MSNRIKLVRICLAVLILLALVMYFVPMVPIRIDCASFLYGVGAPSSCITATSVISYQSPSRAVFARGALLDYSGYYDPGVTFGTISLTVNSVITFIIIPACALAILLFLGKARVGVLTKALMRVLGGGPRPP